jgi:predicted RNA methylase
MHQTSARVGHDDAVAHHPLSRKQLGAWYTPLGLVEHVLDEVLDPVIATLAPGATVSIVDPACGDGRFLTGAVRRLRVAGLEPIVVGTDLDALAVRSCREALADCGAVGATVVHADALAHDWGTALFDVVLGNPPFLSPLAAANGGVRRIDRAGGPYADAAAEFLALALRLAEPTHGRIGFVLPLSIVASRDATPVRAAVEHGAPLDWFWFAPRPVFDAEVRTCAVGLRVGGEHGPIRRSHGKRFVPQSPIEPVLGSEPGAPWSWLLTDQLGVPTLPDNLRLGAELGAIAVCAADFRDEYYGLRGAVEEDGAGPGVARVTSGLIGIGETHWGSRPTRVHKQVYERPVVRVDRLAGAMARWAASRLVPKVLVASQTRVLEAVADEEGAWLPGVPVVSVTPIDPAQVWPIAAALTGPIATIWMAQRAIGSGMSAAAMRVAAPALARFPMPEGSLDPATSAPLVAWWISASKGRRETPRPVRP